MAKASSSKNRTLRFREVDRDSFENIRTGKKSVETRAATVKYQPIAVGDTLTFVCGKDRFVKTVIKVHRWKSINAMLKEIPFKKVMPDVSSIAEMKRVYASYPNYEEKIREHGLIGFEMA